LQFKLYFTRSRRLSVNYCQLFSYICGRDHTSLVIIITVFDYRQAHHHPTLIVMARVSKQHRSKQRPSKLPPSKLGALVLETKVWKL